MSVTTQPSAGAPSAPTARTPAGHRDAVLRGALLALGVLGVAIAGYLTYVHYAGIDPVCTGGGGCEKVQTSQWSSLAGVPVVLAATGGGRRHALVVEHQLRPLFGFFSALSIPTSIYASDEDFEHGELSDPVTLGRIRQAASELSGFVRPASRQPVLTRVA